MIVYNLDDLPVLIPSNNIEKWKCAKEKVVLVSRNNTEYIAGLLRQLELPDAIMIGDNMVRIGIEQPPEFFKQCQSYEEALALVKKMV